MDFWVAGGGEAQVVTAWRGGVWRQHGAEQINFIHGRQCVHPCHLFSCFGPTGWLLQAQLSRKSSQGCGGSCRPWLRHGRPSRATSPLPRISMVWLALGWRTAKTFCSDLYSTSSASSGTYLWKQTALLWTHFRTWQKTTCLILAASGTLSSER